MSTFQSSNPNPNQISNPQGGGDSHEHPKERHATVDKPIVGGSSSFDGTRRPSTRRRDHGLHSFARRNSTHSRRDERAVSDDGVYRMKNTSSLSASFSSNSSSYSNHSGLSTLSVPMGEASEKMLSKLPNNLFRAPSSDNGNGGGADDESWRHSLAKHWEVDSIALSNVEGDDESFNSFSLPQRRRSFDSIETDGSSIWTEITEGGASSIWERVKSSGLLSIAETQNSVEGGKKRNRRRRSIRCAKVMAMLGIAALLALSWSAIYLVIGVNYETMLDLLPHNMLAAKYHHKSHTKVQQQLVYQKLPQGGSVVEIIPASQTTQGIGTNKVKIIPYSPQDKNKAELDDETVLKEKNRKEHLENWD
mmetsp:Transcript_27783/g.57961  ORF Transcript_27783/g.57961 Transcript_27783/m.57961 type:complete len:363 (+) Transcript_27783:25-1113(+)